MRSGEKIVCNAVIGHCGWDTVILLCQDEFETSEKVVAKSIFSNTLLFPGDEIGFISKKKERNHLRLRIIDRVTLNFLPMCGGMSQVIGKALVETKFREVFDIEVKNQKCHIFMETDSGVVELLMEMDESGKVEVVYTQMVDFAKFLDDGGIKEVKLSKIEGIKVGYFLVMDIQKLNQQYSGCKFEDRTDERHQEVLLEIAKEYLEENCKGSNSLYMMMYDSRCEEKGGDIKFYGRFMRDSKLIISPNFEAHCGTGAVAVALGLLKFERNLLSDVQNNGVLSITFEFGNKKIQEEKDPYYGLRKSVGKILYDEEGKNIRSFLYSHEVIEIIFEGRYHIPF